MKLLLILIVLVTAISYVAYSSEHIEENLSPYSSFQKSKGIYGFFSSMVACLWAFDGWADTNFLAEEIIQPEKAS
jgi:amino acid transporter